MGARAGGLALLLVTFTIVAPWFRETMRYTLQGLALMPVFVAAIRFPGWLPFRLLNAGPVAFVGMLSYTLYLSHQVALMGVHFWLPTHGDRHRDPGAGLSRCGVSGSSTGSWKSPGPVAERLGRRASASCVSRARQRLR